MKSVKYNNDYILSFVRCTRLYKATMVVENNVMFQTLLVFMNQSHSVRVAFSYI